MLSRYHSFLANIITKISKKVNVLLRLHLAFWDILHTQQTPLYSLVHTYTLQTGHFQPCNPVSAKKQQVPLYLSAPRFQATPPQRQKTSKPLISWGFEAFTLAYALINSATILSFLSYLTQSNRPFILHFPSPRNLPLSLF